MALDKLMDFKPNAVSIHDYDADGFDEIALSSGTFTAVFKPNKGGILLDLGKPLSSLHSRYHQDSIQALCMGR